MAVTWNELDKLAEKWYNLSDKEPAERQRVVNELFIGTYKLLGKRRDKLGRMELEGAVGEFWIKCMPVFNPNKSHYSAYLKKQLQFIVSDLHEKEFATGKRDVIDPLLDSHSVIPMAEK